MKPIGHNIILPRSVVFKNHFFFCVRNRNWRTATIVFHSKRLRLDILFSIISLTTRRSCGRECIVFSYFVTGINHSFFCIKNSAPLKWLTFCKTKWTLKRPYIYATIKITPLYVFFWIDFFPSLFSYRSSHSFPAYRSLIGRYRRESRNRAFRKQCFPHRVFFQTPTHAVTSYSSFFHIYI